MEMCVVKGLNNFSFRHMTQRRLFTVELSHKFYSVMLKDDYN